MELRENIPVLLKFGEISLVRWALDYITKAALTCNIHALE
jgi:hypothetical protein